MNNRSWRALEFDEEDSVGSSLVVSLKYEPWSGLTWHAVRFSDLSVLPVEKNQTQRNK